MSYFFALFALQMALHFSILSVLRHSLIHFHYHADGLGIRYLYLQTEDKNRILYQQFGFHPLHETEQGIFIMMRDSFEI
ncbi:hypothetical protein [Vibrio porteresiae]|uniref:N-acetyltransferase domain-containing protein n=1 Tax=Vibrio porteresiae DSM 19223 TaxID=1123496 RepID=A0ABZ0Q9D5_9VIBR|nr:hypothetical protein [Vibrio porteresiae]WPC73034.1 hypothetical protein R8Z52_13015 [Vibrio porteresiae DSM 19223]